MPDLSVFIRLSQQEVSGAQSPVKWTGTTLAGGPYLRQLEDHLWGLAHDLCPNLDERLPPRHRDFNYSRMSTWALRDGQTWRILSSWRTGRIWWLSLGTTSEPSTGFRAG